MEKYVHFAVVTILLTLLAIPIYLSIYYAAVMVVGD